MEHIGQEQQQPPQTLNAPSETSSDLSDTIREQILGIKGNRALKKQAESTVANNNIKGSISKSWSYITAEGSSEGASNHQQGGDESSFEIILKESSLTGSKNNSRDKNDTAVIISSSASTLASEGLRSMNRSLGTTTDDNNNNCSCTKEAETQTAAEDGGGRRPQQQLPLLGDQECGCGECVQQRKCCCPECTIKTTTEDGCCPFYIGDLISGDGTITSPASASGGGSRRRRCHKHHHRNHHHRTNHCPAPEQVDFCTAAESPISCRSQSTSEDCCEDEQEDEELMCGGISYRAPAKSPQTSACCRGRRCAACRRPTSNGDHHQQLREGVGVEANDGEAYEDEDEDDGAVSCSSDLFDLPYQNNEEYMRLLHELEKKLIARNRNRVRRTMQEFERRSRQNQNLEKPILLDDGAEQCTTAHRPPNKCSCGYQHHNRNPQRVACSRRYCRNNNNKRTNSDILQNEKRWEKMNLLQSVIRSLDDPKTGPEGRCRHTEHRASSGGAAGTSHNNMLCTRRGSWQMDPRSGEWIKVVQGATCQNTKTKSGSNGKCRSPPCSPTDQDNTRSKDISTIKAPKCRNNNCRSSGHRYPNNNGHHHRM